MVSVRQIFSEIFLGLLLQGMELSVLTGAKVWQLWLSPHAVFAMSLSRLQTTPTPRGPPSVPVLARILLGTTDLSLQPTPPVPTLTRHNSDRGLVVCLTGNYCLSLLRLFSKPFQIQSLDKQTATQYPPVPSHIFIIIIIKVHVMSRKGCGLSGGASSIPNLPRVCSAVWKFEVAFKFTPRMACAPFFLQQNKHKL